MAETAPEKLVVVGSSAGGIEALTRLVQKLPSDFSAPIVIAQHLAPQRVSRLREILTRNTCLSVITVEDQEDLVAGVIYVVPSNFNVEISDHDVRLETPSDGGPRPSIDRLLSSAAEVFKENLIAVILTGTGSDGPAGCLRVKEHNGTVVIQDPETARFPALPLSLSPSVVDASSTMEDMPALLVDLLSRSSGVADGREASEFDRLIARLRDRHGIDFDQYRSPTIIRRLQRRMAVTGQSTVSQYAQYLEANAQEYQRLISSFLIKVTEFFRDTELFEYLRDQLLPRLIEESRSRGNELRFWSAGCSTGEEAYSLAILLAEALGEQLPGYHVRIFASDLDGDAIEFARRGVFSASALESVPPELRDKYFTDLDGEYQVRRSIRGLMIFGQHDLAERAPFPRIDLLLCRNVMMYFLPPLQEHVLRVVGFALRPGGYLVLGKTETTNPLSEYFTVEELKLKIYRREGRKFPSIVPIRRSTRPSVASSSSPQDLAPYVGPSSAARNGARPASRVDRLERLLLHLPAGIAVIDRQYNVRSLNSAAREMLGIYGSAVGEDLVHLAQNVDGRRLRSLIEEAFREGRASVIPEIGAAETLDQPQRHLRITCSVERQPASGSEQSAILLISDITGDVLQRQELESALRQIEAGSERNSAHVERIKDRNRELLRANQELNTVNAELRVTNEEIRAINEELQASGEEVETLNEELQASNEELETLNEELQATVEELNATNEDLRARTAELQDLALSLENERRRSELERLRLSAVLSNMTDAVVVVSRAGEITLSNDAYQQMFGEERFRPRDTEGNLIPPEQSPFVRAARGERFSLEFTLPGDTRAPSYYEVNAQPLTAGEEESASVLVIRDITDRSLRRLQEQFVAAVSHELRTPLTVLNGYLAMIHRQGTVDERTRGYVETSRQQVSRMQSLIRELLDLSRLETGQLVLSLETIDLVELVENTIMPLQSTSDAQRIRLHKPRSTLRVAADPARIEQILVNILNNAMEHAAGSEYIDVRVRKLGNRAEIHIQDYGPGIPEEDLKTIFGRFVRGKDETRGSGLGLGLHIAHELTVAHGGSIDVTSRLGEGTTFTVRLPLSPNGV